MTLTKVTFCDALLCAAERLLAEADYFSEIDARFGDGDHGVAIKKIAQAIQSSAPCWSDQSLKQLIEALGTALMGTGGGAAGPLWGTWISGLALPLPESTSEIDGALLKAMLASALDEIESITPARVGDKTMLDTLIPAVQAAQVAGDGTDEILAAAAAAAAQGAKDTEKYIARFGRAKNYKEQTLGTPDAGAVSLKVFFEGFASGAQ
jgi:phosphoenolpyruvate---glycerone phosphotransferase subunit DhaL